MHGQIALNQTDPLALLILCPTQSDSTLRTGDIPQSTRRIQHGLYLGIQSPKVELNSNARRFHQLQCRYNWCEHGWRSYLCWWGFAPIAIGLCLTLIHLISIPVTNTSVNPASGSWTRKKRRTKFTCSIGTHKKDSSERGWRFIRNYWLSLL